MIVVRASSYISTESWFAWASSAAGTFTRGSRRTVSGWVQVLPAAGWRPRRAGHHRAAVRDHDRPPDFGALLRQRLVAHAPTDAVHARLGRQGQRGCRPIQRDAAVRRMRIGVAYLAVGGRIECRIHVAREPALVRPHHLARAIEDVDLERTIHVGG